MSFKAANTSTERVENSFKQLASAAQALSSASDDLGKVIRQLDASLKKLALGITAWVQVSESADEVQYWIAELGYAKIDGKWGISLRELTGYHLDNEPDATEVWAFNEAPRALRTEAVGKIPDLLEKMLHQTEETTRDLKAKTAQASELATVVSGLVGSAPVAPTQQWHRLGTESVAPASAPAVPAATNGTAAKPATEAEGQGSPKPAPGRFRDSEALPTERISPAGRFRETESLPVERTLPAERPLPAERAV